MAGPYDLNHLVSVPAGVLTTFRAELATAATAVVHTTMNTAFTKLADVALPIDNRYLGQARRVEEWAREQSGTTYDALQAAAKAVIDQATGIA